MTRKEDNEKRALAYQELLSETWRSMGLTCTESINPDYAREFCKKMEIPFKENLIYTKDRYRELSDGKPRVDCEDLLIYVSEKLLIKPNKKYLDLARIMLGEGSRRTNVEKAYILPWANEGVKTPDPKGVA